MKSLLKKIIPQSLLDLYHFLMPLFGAILYGFPSRKLIVIGVTGTNGKSTVVEMCHRTLEEAGYKVASLSSIRFKIVDKDWKNTLKMTMPGRFAIQKFLRQAFDAGCKYAVLEITSEGIRQFRHKFIDFDVAVFTNLSPEHIERHEGFENYKISKGKLFQVCKNTHIINSDDQNAEYFLKFPARKKIIYQVRDNQILINGSPMAVNLKLIGTFNLYNAGAAIGVGLSQGIGLEICKKALEKIEGIPGRLEIVIREPFTVIVDYAHTPDALKKVYQTIKLQGREATKTNKLICVLGAAGGGRDKWKRPELGKIAAEHCDEIILTNEDPYDENPDSILNEIESGFSQILSLRDISRRETNSRYKILDRREAIKKALTLARAGDMVIITGKGCEPWIMGAGGKKIEWDDRKVAREELEKLKIPLAPKETEGFPSGRDDRQVVKEEFEKAKKDLAL